MTFIILKSSTKININSEELAKNYNFIFSALVKEKNVKLEMEKKLFGKFEDFFSSPFLNTKG